MESVYRDPTLDAMHRAVEVEAAKEAPRQYLGASSLGDRCERRLFYKLRNAPSAPRKASLIYAALDGHSCETVLAARLRMVPGVELWTHDKDGKQWGFSDLDGMFRGHADGFIRGLLQAPATSHIWEAKSINEKKFSEFRLGLQKYGEKQVLSNNNWTWYVQAQVYMGYGDQSRHYLTACSPGARDVLSCRTEFVPAFFEAMQEKAKRILDYQEAPARLSDDPAYFECRWCQFRVHCHGL